jgi:hypothetical protein
MNQRNIAPPSSGPKISQTINTHEAAGRALTEVVVNLYLLRFNAV